MKSKILILIAALIHSASILIAQQKTVTFGMGYTKNVSVTASSASPNGIRTLNGVGYLPNMNAASRFLSQATFGATATEAQNVAQIGIEQWLDTQLNLPNSFVTKNYLQSLHQSIVDSMNIKNPAGNYTLNNVGLGDWHFDIVWFQGAMTANDQLRWRVALALSEIFVTSRVSTFDSNPYALASYYDILLRNSFGNYRTMLDEITFHPTMGVYLTYMNNHASDFNPSTGRQIYPDENYAREIMQLFSIGLFKLNPDGTEQKDASGNSIPTYDNSDIANLAKVFTGLSWSHSRYIGDTQNVNDFSYTNPMKFFAYDYSDKIRNPTKVNPRIVDAHERGSKTFLGYTIPNRTDTTQWVLDIRDALDHLSNHQNVAPFISRRLIQRLIKSNPSKEYIGRISAVWANNGSGVRGDLKAVIRAIFLDPEARDCCNNDKDNAQGMLREPFMRYMNLVKGLNLTATGGVFRNVMYEQWELLSQIPMASPTVFNFFLPDYQPDGPVKAAGKYAPEFQLLNSQTITGYHHALNHWLVEDNPTIYWGYFSGETYKPNQDPRFNLNADYPLTKNDRLPELIDKYNMILAAGKLSQSTVDVIRNAISQIQLRVDSSGVVNNDDAYRRLRILLFLIMSSPEYLIQK
jgi:uncharacterized protein (DUF1800 family)